MKKIITFPSSISLIWYWLTAFAYKAKNYAIIFFVFLFLFVLLGAALSRMAKYFLQIFHYLLPRKCVARIGLFSLDSQPNISFAICLLLLETRVTYGVSCALEKLVIKCGINWACKCYQYFSWCKHNLIYHNLHSLQSWNFAKSCQYFLQC